MPYLGWDHFLAPQNAPLPDGLGFGAFSPTHLIVLVLLAIGIAALVVTYKRATEARRRRIRLIMGCATLGLEVLRQVVTVALGLYEPSYLPLHLCGMIEFVVFADGIHTSRWSREPLYALGLWGAACALLFPDWVTRPIFNLFTWQAFLIHACIIGYILMRLVSRDFVPNWRNLWCVVIVMAPFIGLAVWANVAFGTNFWYLSAGSTGSPLEPIQEFAGPYYIPFLGLLVLILWTLLYLPWSLHSRRR